MVSAPRRELRLAARIEGATARLREIFDLKIVTNGVGCDIHHQRSVTRSTRAVTRSAR